jgi:phage tail protein X
LDLAEGKTLDWIFERVKWQGETVSVVGSILKVNKTSCDEADMEMNPRLGMRISLPHRPAVEKQVNPITQLLKRHSKIQRPGDV